MVVEFGAVVHDLSTQAGVSKLVFHSQSALDAFILHYSKIVYDEQAPND